ncbi:hypothetical protein PG997_013138 [Apiospora hydei]|uniref:Transposase n=1 Tax=Apiospora hydei TaxID=1337664 RepID=A0ABR1V5B9_9PEZI
MPSFLEKIQAKIELYRLEQRYTRNRNRRSTFISNAVYVDGELVDKQFLGLVTRGTVQPTQCRRPRSPTHVLEPQTPAHKKRLNRLSAMPGFGSLSKSSGRDLRNNSVDVHEVR